MSITFLEAVGTVCIHGITLSKDIIRFFPRFTLHDETHIVNVCNWMTRLLGDKKRKISAYEVALLVMSACCHDIGMSVSDDQKASLTANLEGVAWRDYFENHPRDDEEYSKTGKISEEILRNFVRSNHHKRIDIQMRTINWPQALQENGISRPTLVKLCQNHGESLDDLTPPNGQPYNLRLCAVLLRLADILDFDPSRAPVALFKHLGLEHPTDLESEISRTEWAKNRSGVFGEIKDGILPFTASFTSLQLELEVRSYLNWVQQEMDTSREYLHKYSGDWSGLTLPRKISTDSVERNGYQYGEFCLTMDQDRVLEMFTGKNLYNDPGVFVRELLQNSIDAIMTRIQLDPYFSEKDGKITIYSWMDEELHTWFRIEDNGIGMDTHIITNYFLKAGRSYYTSDEFMADKRHYGNGADYTPISRFGIGILSCFMSDPDNNLLEVSTKRYSHDPQRPHPAIRLNVTGLHGYYYLAEEQKQDELDEFFQPIHHPQNMDSGYRSKPGTTICVRVNLYKMNNYRSMKEIIDKYVCFPEIHVEYIGPEGHIFYPTQRDLMTAVHSLNPDGPGKAPKRYVHPIPNSQFMQLKEKMIYTTWEKTPSIILQYYPLDWFVSSGNINGVAILATLEAAATNSPFHYEEEQILPEYSCSLYSMPSSQEILLEFSNSFPIGFREKMEILQKNSYPLQALQYKQEAQSQPVSHQDHDALKYFKEYSNKTITITYEDILLQSGAEEATVFRYITEPLHNINVSGSKSIFNRNRDSHEIIAYNGILADCSHPLNVHEGYLGFVLLLQGDCCLKVNLARDTISNLPLETACDLSLMLHKMPQKRWSEPPLLRPEKYAFPTARELQQLLQEHPTWGKQLQQRSFAWGERLEENGGPSAIIHISPPYVFDFPKQCFCKFDGFSIMLTDKKEWQSVRDFNRESLHDWLWLTTLKNFSSTDGEKDSDIANYPVILFLLPPSREGPLGYITSSHNLNYYNREHCFSRWLIRHRENLQKHCLDIYNRLIYSMIQSNSKAEIIEIINHALTLLKNFQHNLFEVSDAMLLEPKDLVEKKS